MTDINEAFPGMKPKPRIKAVVESRSHWNLTYPLPEWYKDMTGIINYIFHCHSFSNQYYWRIYKPEEKEGDVFNTFEEAQADLIKFLQEAVK